MLVGFEPGYDCQIAMKIEISC